MIVADSNLIAYLLIPGDKSVLAEKVFMKDHEWAVPLICRSEMRNILTLYMRYEGMSLSQAVQTMEQAEKLWGAREYAVPSDSTLELTCLHKITAYDAEYVILAQKLGIPLVTFDKAVLKEFNDTAISATRFAG